MARNILEYLEKSAEKFPAKTAFADEYTQCTYEELKHTAQAAGTYLAQYTAPGEPVPVFMEKSVRSLP